ncbi:hypothetical protein TNCV_4537341 [Trichonephila clavipes]|nr:hypothetical protein TNCV_4537341 [Trichonephila clavipes]
MKYEVSLGAGVRLEHHDIELSSPCAGRVSSILWGQAISTNLVILQLGQVTLKLAIPHHTNRIILNHSRFNVHQRFYTVDLQWHQGLHSRPAGRHSVSGGILTRDITDLVLLKPPVPGHNH